MTPGSARYFAWLYTPAERREAVAALFTLEHEIASSARPGIDHAVAHARLDWWEDEASRLAAGRPAHPAGQKLLERVSRAEPASAFRVALRVELRGLVENARWDHASAPFESQSEMDGYCARWARAVIVPLALLAGASPASEREPASRSDAALLSVGAALREIELLASLDADARRGRLRVPLDVLDRLDVDPAVLARPPWPAPLSDHLRRRHEILRTALDPAFARSPDAARSPLRTLAVWASLAARRSKRLERALPQLPRELRRSALADAFAAWSTARRARRESS